ncbi:PsiF family protein [Nitrospira lenta]|uniref:Phosphate starvation-inducible protein PsiF n=1 Tax=Nitrospira lenta TaxID=1436998 RepID=A0A330L934_9BACT|nr:PsiF family protein [Nitrospira lenta]SPP65601.1 Phosphate starvation-inducible protein PsiF [Nitrospira lenta]
MKIASLLSLSLFCVVIVLAPVSSEAAGQQNKMTTCNKEANEKGLGEGKGDERKAFMKECLSAKPVKNAKTAQQEKMKACNKEAGEKTLKGDERKKFMSTCLSN